MPAPRLPRLGTEPGFTMIEMMITLAVLAVVMVVLMGVVTMASRSRASNTNRVESSQAARIAMDLISRDLRSAGYGADADYVEPQPPIAYVDSLQILINENLEPLIDNSPLGKGPPLAYNPASAPNPFPLVSTIWTPPIRYRTGAELVRWTLDINNDGRVDAADVDGTDAEHTTNPDDYLLVREVYGDSSGGAANNNGGAQERVGLIRRPGGTVPPLFTVYLKGQSAPWNWSAGPVPPAQLANIERIQLNVVAPSPRSDSRGDFAETVFRTEVSSLRNTPDLGSSQSAVDGYVFEDVNHDHLYDPNDIPLAGVRVRLGVVSTLTNSSGYYQIHALSGTQTLRHDVPDGYAVAIDPDTFVVNMPPGATHSFADSALSGGWVTLQAFRDLNSNAVADAGEGPMAGTKFTLMPGSVSKTTTASGSVSLFVPTGSYSITVTAPDSFATTTANPITGSMTNGGSATYSTGLAKTALGEVQGKVFIDTNKNGVLDAGEPGAISAWVGITTDGGYTVQAFAYTDANGNYTIDVPINNPPGTNPYSVMCIVPAGYYATSTTSINGVFVSDGQVLTGKNFGLGTFQIISLTTSRVLSLGSADLIEKDWNGNQTQNAHKDADIVLGAESSGTEQISVWFNQYNGSPLFPTIRTYARTAPNSVMAMAVDSLDRVGAAGRADIVTGTKLSAAGNLFVWYCQGSSGNEGYFPTAYSQAYRTLDNGDVQAVLTYDCAGGLGPDIIAGTNAGGYRGTIEIWQNSDALQPTFTRQEIYPPAGGLPGNPSWIGEVTAMTLADVDGDGARDLVVATKTSAGSGQVLVFKYVSKLTGARFTHKCTLDCTYPATSVTCTDVDGDGHQDVIVGVQVSSTSGQIQYWRNRNLNFSFSLDATSIPPGIPLSLGIADLGGLTRPDIVCGYRTNTTSYGGGVRVYSTDSGVLPATGSDPSGGQVVNMVPAMTVANFNYGVQPSTPLPPYLADVAVGVKISDTTGALVVMVR